MKKLLSLFLALIMVFSLTACSGGTDLEQDLQDLENILGAFEEIGQGLYAETEGEEETANLNGSAGSDEEAWSEDEDAYSDDIIEFTTQGAQSEETAGSQETVATETATEATEENELPPVLFYPEETTTASEEVPVLDENGVYTTMEDVALYIYTYGKLPSNFITKKEAQALGWPGGYLEPYAPGKCIGGDRFGNYEGLLPTNKKYTECDIDTLGAKSRGAKRIVFSNDCQLIYYTDDHYESFTLLYGEE